MTREIDELQWELDRSTAGQGVEVSHAYDPETDRLWRRTYDRSVSGDPEAPGASRYSSAPCPDNDEGGNEIELSSSQALCAAASLVPRSAWRREWALPGEQRARKAAERKARREARADGDVI